VRGARLFSGEAVAVKVLRPNLLGVIEQDLALMRFAATWIERVFADGKRLKPREVVAEFDKYLHDELDLMREAANASQLGRQFAGSDKLIVPQVFFDYCSREVLTIEWMDGTPISDIGSLKAQGIDLKQLARYGVEIFFTQVFSHGFFHADMHPGNILVAADGRYIALDFGIVGSLTDYDKRYLAINFLAFFNRDYHRVATAHIESGWVPPDTRAEDLEAAVRTRRLRARLMAVANMRSSSWRTARMRSAIRTFCAASTPISQMSLSSPVFRSEPRTFVLGQVPSWIPHTYTVSHCRPAERAGVRISTAS